MPFGTTAEPVLLTTLVLLVIRAVPNVLTREAVRRVPAICTRIPVFLRPDATQRNMPARMAEIMDEWFGIGEIFIVTLLEIGRKSTKYIQYWWNHPWTTTTIIHFANVYNRGARAIPGALLNRPSI
ncbi:MAG: hypothetical protein D6761_10200 [Candidatus Dadabacteria bacterium]|nr:MAG: hypothetical protein D6761_10200 [Candidatus Dadabacteria bacterium]